MNNLRSALLSLPALLLIALCTLPLAVANAQSASARLSGTVEDQNGAVVPGATVTAENKATGLKRQATTNGEGYFTIPLLPPSTYSVTAQAAGFSPVQVSNVVLNVGDQKSLQIQLKAGNITEVVKIRGDAPLINESAAVGTVVDRNFAENIPMNGRSFQTLIQLTPGVVVVPTNVNDQGQFSVNGQRATSNYWTVDGVSANIGISALGAAGNGSGMAGSLGSFSALGGTNSLVSVDAMQEFRIQTSTYAPEFGRQPGGQISIVTRSGSNQFHGTLFDYLRNDALDANNWFNTSVVPALPKPKERQNDFGSTFSGPIFKDRTFFFFSYEGLRLRLPQTAIGTVPDLAARQSATPEMQPFLNAFPLPNGTDNVATGVAQFNSSFSSSASLDAASLRLDHKINDRIGLFARYDYSPSEVIQRGGGTLVASVVTPIKITTQTGTVGATWSVSPSIVNDLRFNYSRTSAKSRAFLDDFGGAVPLASLPFPSPFNDRNASLVLTIFSLSTSTRTIREGLTSNNAQRQINLVDSLSLQSGSHGLKFGVDYRRLSPVQSPAAYLQSIQFASVATAETGNTSSTLIISSAPVNFLFRNLGAFAQDTWRVIPRLTLTYGLRWDVDFAPATLNGPSVPAVTGFDLNDLSRLTIAPPGTPPYSTTYGNIAPRIGVAFQLRQDPNWQSVLRGGFGVFYDLASARTGALAATSPPFGANRILGPQTFPPSPSNSAPPAIPSSATLAQLLAINPNLKLPYTLQWNFALEQALGRQQVLSLSYVGAAGRRLLQTTTFASPPPSNPSLLFGQFVDDSGNSDYDALQIQFQRRLSRGLQAQASYSWAHSIDTGSASSGQLPSNEGGQGNANRGPSDFDIRHSFSLGVTYDVPMPLTKALAKAVLHGWSLDSVVQARSAPPVDVSALAFFALNNLFGDVRPDLVPGEPLYLFGNQYPGGKAFNPAAFKDPPTAPGLPARQAARQGNVPRNFLRGFGAAQWDFAVHRDFPIHESVRLQFRAETFNVLNHPNFGQPSGGLFSPAPSNFGVATQTLNSALAGSGTTGAGSFNPLYQIGGPRSIQFGLKLFF